jgi:S1-C subfamily serine protease
MNFRRGTNTPGIGTGILLVCAAACCDSALAQTGRLVAQKAMPSVVRLIMSDSDGRPLSLGTGFVVADGIVATNLHVIAGASQGRAKLVEQQHEYPVSGSVGVSEESDLVLLRVAGLKAYALPLARDESVAIGDEVYVIGNPSGLEGTISAGIVSRIREIEQRKVLQITAPISAGSSGGPVLNEKAEVIGVAVATLKDGQNLNFAVPVSNLSLLLSKPAAETPSERPEGWSDSPRETRGGGVPGQHRSERAGPAGQGVHRRDRRAWTEVCGGARL